MNYELRENLNDLGKCVDLHKENLSRFTLQLIYQILGEYDDNFFDQERGLDEWKKDVITEIDNILEIMDRSRYSDIQFLTNIKILLNGRKKNCKCTEIANSTNFFLN